jgi:hypothetical protein
MNPRHRRLLIPGLLIALLVVVLVSSLARKADGAESEPVVVSRISDPRITESSGLAVSVRHDDLAYTINDSGHEPIVFAVTISTGDVVGATTVAGGALRDTEALAIDRSGRLWVADTGDNDQERDDVALYVLPEPGRGDHAVTATRYPVAYTDGPKDVEALLVDPRTGTASLVTKEILGGQVLALPEQLSTTRPNLAEPVADGMPLLVTDGALTTSGRYALLRTYNQVIVYDARTWEVVRSEVAPVQKQGESIAIERSGRSFLLGSEGVDSPLIRMPLTPAATTPAATRPSPTPEPVATVPADRTGESGGEFPGSTWLWAVGVVALLGVVSVAATRRG